MKKVLIVAFIIVVVVGAVFYFVKANNGKENGLTYVKVTRGEIVEKALAIGNIVPKQEIFVKSKISGIARKVLIEVGDHVKPGDVLIEIQPDPTPLEYAEARRNVELAQIDLETIKTDYQRSKELHEKGIISPQAYDDKLGNYREAKLRVNIAEEKFALVEKGRTKIVEKNMDSLIRSPIEGTILERKVNEGDPIVPLTSYQAGTELITMADMSFLLFKGTVDEIDVGKIREGMKVNIKIGALPDTVIKGTLVRISPKAKKEENATLFDVEIKIDDSEGTTIRAGYSANADVIIQKKDKVITIPERLVEFKEEKAYVEVQGENNQVNKKEIQTGLSDGIMIEVTSGLKEGEMLVERPPKEIT